MRRLLAALVLLVAPPAFATPPSFNLDALAIARDGDEGVAFGLDIAPEPGLTFATRLSRVAVDDLTMFGLQATGEFDVATSGPLAAYLAAGASLTFVTGDETATVTRSGHGKHARYDAVLASPDDIYLSLVGGGGLDISLCPAALATIEVLYSRPLHSDADGFATVAAGLGWRF